MSIVNIIVEYPDDSDFIDKNAKFNVTLKSGGEIVNNVYTGDFVNSLIHSQVENLFVILRLIDSFGFLEVEGPDEPLT